MAAASPRHAWIARLSPRAQTFVLCLTLSLGYCTTYLFTRPYFVLPGGYLNSTAGALNGAAIDRQSALALAQSLGYLCSKWPAVVLMSSSTFFRYRQRALTLLFAITAVISGVGFAVFDAAPVAQSVCVGLSSVTVGMVVSSLGTFSSISFKNHFVCFCSFFLGLYRVLLLLLRDDENRSTNSALPGVFF
jgi:hypothetical protein